MSAESTTCPEKENNKYRGGRPGGAWEFCGGCLFVQLALPQFPVGGGHSRGCPKVSGFCRPPLRGWRGFRASISNPAGRAGPAYTDLSHDFPEGASERHPEISAEFPCARAPLFLLNEIARLTTFRYRAVRV